MSLAALFNNNMWSQVIYGLLKALLEYFDTKLKEPSTIQNVKTPDELRRDWHNYLIDKLRNKNGGN